MDLRNIAKIYFLQDFDLFKELERKTLLETASQLEMLYLSKGSELLLKEKNNNLTFFLNTGKIKVVNQPNNYTKYILKEGNIFGELSSINLNIEEKQFDDTNDIAVALEDAVIFYIKTSQMQSLMDRHNGLKNKILNLYSAKIKNLEKRLEDLLYKDSKTRITDYLFNYLTEHGTQDKNKITAENLLSHSDIAHLTNTSRQTVNNVMSALRKDGVINYDSTKIERTTSANSRVMR